MPIFTLPFIPHTRNFSGLPTRAGYKGRIQSHPIRAIVGTEGIQQMCGSSITEQRHQDIFVHILFPDMLLLTRTGYRRFHHSDKSLQGSGFQYKLGEELSESRAIYRIPEYLNSLSYRVTLSEGQLKSLTQCLSLFQLGKCVTFRLCLHLLVIM